MARGISDAALAAIDSGLVSDTLGVSKGFTGIRPITLRTVEENPVQNRFRLAVDYSRLESRFGYVSGALHTLFSRMDNRNLGGALRQTLLEVFTDAIYRAGDGFFKEYATHLLGMVENIPITYEAFGEEGWRIQVNFDSLGTYYDLIPAFHRGALIAPSEGGGDMARVQLPYKGQRLRLPYSRRYAFWQAVYTGTPFQPAARNGRNPPAIPTAGLLDETIADRIRVWDEQGKAPEWLFLQFGQMRSEPVIQPQYIIEAFEEQAAATIYSIYEDELDAIVQDAQTISYYEDTRTTNPITGLFVTGAAAVNVASATAAYERYYNLGQQVEYTRIGKYGAVGLRGAKGRFVSFI